MIKLSSIVLKPIDFLWIRTGSKPYWKIKYSIAYYIQFSTNMKMYNLIFKSCYCTCYIRGKLFLIRFNNYYYSITFNTNMLSFQVLEFIIVFLFVYSDFYFPVAYKSLCFNIKKERLCLIVATKQFSDIREKGMWFCQTILSKIFPLNPFPFFLPTYPLPFQLHQKNIQKFTVKLINCRVVFLLETQKCLIYFAKNMLIKKLKRRTNYGKNQIKKYTRLML